MAAPDWVSYVSLVSGVGGAVLSCLAYRRTAQLKALDLRLELRRIDADVRNQVKSLPDRLDYAKRSRERVSAALGSYQSGAMQQWQTEWIADQAHLKELEALLPIANNNYRGVKPAELETQLVSRHKLFSLVDALDKKYVASVAQDDKNRDFIRAQRTPPSP